MAKFTAIFVLTATVLAGATTATAHAETNIVLGSATVTAAAGINA